MIREDAQRAYKPSSSSLHFYKNAVKLVKANAVKASSLYIS